MSNTIQKAKKYVNMLDEVYKLGSLTSVLDSNPALAKEGANVGEIVIPKISMDGLSDYSRTNGYTVGDISFIYQTKPFNYDRGKMFIIDAMDDEETAGMAFGTLSGEFVRTKTIPEIDAFRIASYSTLAANKINSQLTTGEAVVAAIRTAINTQDNLEVTGEKYIFINPSLLGLVKDLDLTKSKDVLGNFTGIVSMPSTRLYTAITLGTNGYSKAAEAGDVNFIIVEKSAVLQFMKHVAPKIVNPQTNQDADAWKFGYRILGLNDAFDNKLDGIYCHYYKEV